MTTTADAPTSWPTTGGAVTTVARVADSRDGTPRYVWLVISREGRIVTSSRTVFRRRHLAARDARRYFPES